MISICIPIYNFDVTKLVNSLAKQSSSLEVLSEIILIDDCSEIEYKQINEEVCKQHRYIELVENIGRAAIRNRFLEYANYDYLLFLDCDSIICLDIFLKTYVDSLRKDTFKVICGGRIYPKSPPERKKMLRWKYGVKVESKPFHVRNKKPNKSFMTNNFVISKKVLGNTKFDERLVQYGHEDTLFGFELKKKNIAIAHIENPVLNGDLEENGRFMKSTELALENLVLILKNLNYDKKFIEDIPLLRLYYRLFAFKGVIAVFFKFLKPVIKRFLVKDSTSLYLFHFYKLGYFTKKMSAKN